MTPEETRHSYYTRYMRRWFADAPPPTTTGEQTPMKQIILSVQLYEIERTLAQIVKVGAIVSVSTHYNRTGTPDGYIIVYRGT